MGRSEVGSYFTVSVLLNGFPHQVNRSTLGREAWVCQQASTAAYTRLVPGVRTGRDERQRTLQTVSPSIRVNILRLYELLALLDVIADVRIPVQAIEQ